jgi:hypothetical protein
LKGKVLTIAAHMDGDRVDAGQEVKVRQYNDALKLKNRRETVKIRRRKKRMKSGGVKRRPPMNYSSNQGQ